MKTVKIYTDGGCANNQERENIGGWGAILEYGKTQKEINGGKINTTNNQMELTAVIEAFMALKKDNLTIEVFSDSSYVMNCFREKWYEYWENNNWKTKNKKPVENQDLWKILLSQVKKHNVTFYRVKGHVNLSSKTTDAKALYEKFKEWNGDKFSFDDFKYVTEMNNRADWLVNQAIDELK